MSNCPNKSTLIIVFKMAIHAVKYKPMDNCDTQMQQYDRMECASNLSNINWWEELETVRNYARYLADFITTLLEFETTWDSHLGGIKASQHGIKLTPSDKQQTQPAIPDQPGGKAQEIWNFKDGRVGSHRTGSNRGHCKLSLTQNIWWHAPFLIEYGKLNECTVRNSYPISSVNEWINYFMGYDCLLNVGSQ